MKGGRIFVIRPLKGICGLQSYGWKRTELWFETCGAMVYIV